MDLNRPEGQHHAWQCEGLFVDTDRREVLREGRACPLGSRAFDLLVALIERHDRVVGKHELLDLVWPDTIVEENNLQVQVSALRKVFGARSIATVPGRGYRFTGALQAASPAPAAWSVQAGRVVMAPGVPPLPTRSPQPAAILSVERMTPDVARAIHRVQQLAYAQEAVLLGARDFPPLRRTPADIADSTERFWVALVDGVAVGSASVEGDEELPDGLRVASLVVQPALQRAGIGTALLQAVLAAVRRRTPLAVHTGARNAPALALYGQHGFVPVRRWFIEPGSIEMARLVRGP